MASHDNFSKFSKQYFRNFFDRWHNTWDCARPFIFIHYNSRRYELVFIDEMDVNLGSIVADPKRFHMKMRALRVQLGCTQESWAKQLGITKSNLSAIERGARRMSEKMRERFSKVAKDNLKEEAKTNDTPSENSAYDSPNQANTTLSESRANDPSTKTPRALPGVEDDNALANWLSTLKWYKNKGAQ